MHTVRIISHKSDRESRKLLVARIAYAHRARANVVVPPHDDGTGQTILDYDMIGGRTDAVKIIDLDWSADVTVGADDVFYVALEFECDEYGNPVGWSGDHAAANASRSLWAKSVSAPATRLWWTNGYGKDGGCCAEPVRYGPNREPARFVFIPARDGLSPWFDLIRERFGISGGMQSVRTLLERLDTQPARSVVKPSDAPWPLPSMTIMLPTYATVTGTTHDPTTGALTITFE